jgi:hypothetical protein
MTNIAFAYVQRPTELGTNVGIQNVSDYETFPDCFILTLLHGAIFVHVRSSSECEESDDGDVFESEEKKSIASSPTTASGGENERYWDPG